MKFSFTELDMSRPTLCNISLAGVFLMLCTSHSHSQGNFWDRTDGPYIGTIDALVVDSSGIVFAGTGGDVYRSTNQGDEWFDPGAFTASCFALKSQSVLFAGGGNSIHRTTDGGVSWSNAGTFDNTVHSVAVEPQGNLLAGTGDIAPHGETSGGLYRSTNDGTNWSRIIIPDTGAYSIVAHSSGVLVAATLWGRVLHSTDGGSSWLPSLLSGVFFITGDHLGGLYACSDCCVYRSLDTGRTWSQIFVTGNSVSRVVVDGNARIFVSMYRGGISYSTDNGSTWNPTSMTSTRVYSVALDFNGTIYAGLFESGVYRSTDNGVSWVQRVHGFPNLWTISLAVSPSGTMYAGTYYLGLWRTTNNGEVWTRNALGYSVVRALAAQSTGNIYAGTEGALYRSTNDGTSWTQLNLGIGSPYVLSLSVAPSGVIFAGTADNLYHQGNVFRSSDNGGTWTSVLENVMPVWSVVSSDGLHIFAGTYTTSEAAKIYRSTDSGSTWNASYTAPLNHYVASLTTSPDGVVFSGIAHIWDPNGGFGVVRSTDHGATWSRTTNGLTNLNVISLAVNSTGQVLAGTLWGGVFSSTNNGDDWTPINSGLTETRVWALAFDSSGFAYAGTQGGGGVYRSLQSTIVSVGNTDLNVPNAIVLQQNHPNPFNPITIIGYTIPSGDYSHISLLIFDVLGREVARLVDQVQEPGHKLVEWNASNTPSGVYFYRLTVGAFTETKKLVLIR